jgi:monoamine oxidase
VADWLDEVGADPGIRAMTAGLRGFFLADPNELSLIALVDQMASENDPGWGKMFRIAGGNDRIATAIAERLGTAVRLNTCVLAASQSPQRVTASVRTAGGTVEQLTADFLIFTLPASTLRDVRIEPELPAPQHEAIARLQYGRATKTLIQFDRRFWRVIGRARAFGTDLPIGAVWDGDEQQRGPAGILTLLAGGSASDATKALLADGGPAAIVAQLGWLEPGNSRVLASLSVSWEDERWSRGGYAVIDPAFDPSLREWLARPCGRLLFAGEHTSVKWQGYMNGAVETGLRAAAEVKALVESLKN